MRPAGMVRLAAAAAVLAGMATPVGAQQLDPQVAGPLMQLMNAAGMQCQAGNMQACGLGQQLQQMGNQLLQAQFGCQQGNAQACQVFQMGAQQVLIAHQQHFGSMQGGGMPQGQGYAMQQQTYDHQQRMMQQQQMFQQHQDRMAQQRQMQDESHRRFMQQLRQ